MPVDVDNNIKWVLSREVFILYVTHAIAIDILSVCHTGDPRLNGAVKIGYHTME